MSRNIPPGNRLHTDRALFGTDKGRHGPVKHIVKDGVSIQHTSERKVGLNWSEEEVLRITREQELAEQDYTQGCPNPGDQSMLP